MLDWSGMPAAKALEYFETICGIPHPSGHVQEISDFCVAFAKERGLKVRQDEAGNVIIWKAASPGRENDRTVMIQGHLDMVPAAAEGKSFDFAREPLSLSVDGDFLHADGTTLGADDGIAVAACLAILADDTLSHPPLIGVFTTDEEVGMLGAMVLDMSDLQASFLLNLDHEVEGSAIVSCAGGGRAALTFPLAWEKVPAGYEALRMDLSGLKGGHSGVLIHLGRTNGIRKTGECLKNLFAAFPDAILSDLSGGSADNAIPSSAAAVVAVPAEQKEAFCRAAEEWTRNALEAIREKEPEAVWTLREAEKMQNGLPARAALDLLEVLLSLPDGALVMSPDLPGLTQTSCNTGVVQLGEKARITVSVRSSVEEEKQALLAEIQEKTEKGGGTVTLSGVYPGWPVNPGSPLVELAAAIWEEMYQKPMKVEAVHGGLECGIFSQGIPGIDIISLGPDMFDIHTPRERLSISSTNRFWAYICRLLEELH